MATKSTHVVIMGGLNPSFRVEAASLFRNMMTPATVLSGALVALGIISPLPILPTSSLSSSAAASTGAATAADNDNNNERRFHKILRHIYPVVAVLSLTSEFVALMWATVACNQLTEAHLAPASSVWELLQRDFDIHWSGTNTHFFAGLLGFSFLVGSRAYFHTISGTSTHLGPSVAGIAMSGILLMVSIVNRAVASGGRDASHRYGNTILALWQHYMNLLWQRATHRKSFGFLEVSSIVVFGWSMFMAIRGIIDAAGLGKEKRK